MKALVLEDNPIDKTALEHFANNHDAIEEIYGFSNAAEALDFLEKEKVDLVFLDIEIPDMSGIEFMDKLPYLPQIVITTGNKKYAYDAFEYEVTDFLVKPINVARFQKALDKVIANYEKRNEIALDSAATELYVKTDGKHIRLPYGEILYFENVGDYIKVITERGNYVIYGALKLLAQKLTHPCFLKVHRSFIVNLRKIVDIEDNSLVIGSKVIPISRAHKPILLNSINVI